ncbi:MAG: aminotransferase class I/II-fold pyridoxal phosphate-dependent enzyme [Patescibacteria group bacterium]|nr:aminotransferase class I/II-fold pyridoxal phosphate-dependent enzyme [Patescibacteria group bacterium]
MNAFKPISISLSPNTEKDDIVLSLKEIVSFGFLRSQGREINELEKEFSDKIGVRHAVSFNSGRSALMAILSAFKLEKGDEVLLQAFTCNAVPNPVLWSSLKPVYVDCEEDYNISPQDLERKITKKSRAVIVQHTFGKPADMDKIQTICQQNNLLLIEDCAHALGAEYKGVGVGTFGDVAFFSFSRDKVISSVYGGMAATNNAEYGKALRKFQAKAGFPSSYWSLQQLLHPVLMNWIVLPTYRILGKYLLLLFQLLHILSKAVHFSEKRGRKPSYFPKAMPNTLAKLALLQLSKVDRFNEHRKKMAGYYKRALLDTSFEVSEETSGHIFLRLPVRHPNAYAIIRKAWDANLLLGDWYTSPVAPADTKLEAVGYVKGSCRKAEELALITLNLPTHIRITENEAKRTVKFIKQHAD